MSLEEIVLCHLFYFYLFLSLVESSDWDSFGFIRQDFKISIVVISSNTQI